MEHLFDKRVCDELTFCHVRPVRVVFVLRSRRKGFGSHRFSRTLEPVSRTFQCDNQGRRTDEHRSGSNCTRVFCTSAFPHVNELKSAIKDENAGKHPDVRVFLKGSPFRASGVHRSLNLMTLRSSFGKRLETPGTVTFNYLF